MSITIQNCDIGCEPSPSVPAETLLQDGWSTYLLFFAVSKSVGADGYLQDKRVAILECEHCAMSKFGYPNDEGLPEHPFYQFGLAGATSAVLEALGSPWMREVTTMMDGSRDRIWGSRGAGPSASSGERLRHFIILLKECTFECLASRLVVSRFVPDFAQAYSYVQARFAEH